MALRARSGEDVIGHSGHRERRWLGMPEHDLQTLRLFCAVIEEGSIASAARRCSIAPSAVSKRIADLEHHAKVALLYRLRDGVEATSAGLALYGHAKSVLEAVGRLDSELSEFALGLSGRIRIFANTSAITQFLPEDLKHFGDSTPMSASTSWRTPARGTSMRR